MNQLFSGHVKRTELAGGVIPRLRHRKLTKMDEKLMKFSHFRILKVNVHVMKVNVLSNILHCLNSTLNIIELSNKVSYTFLRIPMRMVNSKSGGFLSKNPQF